MDRQTFLDALAAEMARWEDLLLGLTPAQATAPAVIGEWSVRDLAAHIAFWTHHTAAHVAAIREGRTPTEADLYGEALPPEVSPDDVDAVNAWIQAKTASLSFEEAQAFARLAADRLAQEVAALDETLLTDPQRQFPGLPWKGERTLLEVLMVLTLDHAREHRAELERWLATQSRSPFNAALRRELLAMRDRDQALGRSVIEHWQSGTSIDPSMQETLIAANREHIARMKEIVRDYGWPGISLVGDDGAQAAWLLVQHADADIEFQQCLALMEAAVAAGEARPQDLAYLTDRVRFNTGQPQVYGTQVLIIDGKVTLKPIEDEANVDARRAEVGLEPLADYVADIERMLAPLHSSSSS